MKTKLKEEEECIGHSPPKEKEPLGKKPEEMSYFDGNETLDVIVPKSSTYDSGVQEILVDE